MKPFNNNEAREAVLNPGDWAFHGDVIIEALSELPEGWESWPIVKDRALAYGEATGHIHQLSEGVEVRENPATQERYFVTKGNVTYLRHQEHDPIAFKATPEKPVIAKSRIAKEYDHFEELVRQVID